MPGKTSPKGELPPNLLKYMVADGDNGNAKSTYQEAIQQERNDADAVEWKPKLSAKRFVKRDEGFKRVDSVETIPGEQLYRRDLNATPPRYVRYGKVRL